MKRIAIGAAAIVALAGTAMAQRERIPAECRQEIVQMCRGAEGGFRQCLRTALPKLSDACRKTLAGRSATALPLPPGMTEMSYGRDPLQRLDLIAPAGDKRPPLIVFVHGGGWSVGDKRHALGAKADHFVKAGYAFASLNYRLVPGASVEQQAADITAALAWLRAYSMGSNYDGERIVLMGHSAGAHLVALIAADPTYLAAAKVPMSSIKGVVLLDGAGYDIAQQMNRPGNPVASMYDAAFGKDPARQRALSPTLHAAAPNAANWLILPVASRPDSIPQSKALAAGLIKANSQAMVIPVQGESHGSLNKGLGETGDFATAKVDAFLDAL